MIYWSLIQKLGLKGLAVMEILTKSVWNTMYTEQYHQHHLTMRKNSFWHFIIKYQILVMQCMSVTVNSNKYAYSCHLLSSCCLNYVNVKLKFVTVGHTAAKLSHLKFGPDK